MPIDPITVKLDEPVTIGSGDKAKTYAEITFTHKAKGRDFAAGDLVKGNTNRSYAIFASMAGVPITVFQEMDADDLTKVSLAAVPLFGERAKKAAKALEEEPDPIN